MATWTTMTDLGPGDLVTAADMDAIRGNIEYLLDPNKLALSEVGPYSITGTSYADVDATNLKANITTNGGPVALLASWYVYGNDSTSVNISCTFARNGTVIDSDAKTTINVHYSTTFWSGAVVLIDDQAAGTYSYSLQALVNTSNAYLRNISFVAWEI